MSTPFGLSFPCSSDHKIKKIDLNLAWLVLKLRYIRTLLVSVFFFFFLFQFKTILHVCDHLTVLFTYAYICCKLMRGSNGSKQISQNYHLNSKYVKVYSVIFVMFDSVLCQFVDD